MNKETNGKFRLSTPVPVDRNKPEHYECWLFGDGWHPFDKYIEDYNKLSPTQQRSFTPPDKIKIRVKP